MSLNKNLGDLMKQAQKMQQRMQEAQQQLTELVVIGDAGSGMVTVKMNGRHDVLDVKIDTLGGDVVALSLPTYTKTVDSKEAFSLLENSKQRLFVAQSGLIGANGADARPEGRPIYQSPKVQYSLVNGQSQLQVPLYFTDKNGVEIQKTFTFTQGKYDIDVSYKIINRSANPWHGLMFAQLKRDHADDPSKNNQGMGMVTYLGGAWGNKEKNYNKISFEDFNEEMLQ